MMAEVWKSRSNYQLALEEKKNQIEKEEKRSHEKRYSNKCNLKRSQQNGL